MLNGLDPLIILEFSKNTTDSGTGAVGVPVAKSFISKITLPAIPVYLNEQLTGIYIDTEEKNIDINTDVETSVDAKGTIVNQRAIANVVKITMIAHKSSIGMTLLSAFTDKIFPLVTSKEYTISYIHGPIVVLSGLLHSFSLTQNSSDELYHITMELIKPALQTGKGVPSVSAPQNGVQLVAGKAVGA